MGAGRDARRLRAGRPRSRRATARRTGRVPDRGAARAERETGRV